MNEFFAFIRRSIDNAGTILVDKKGQFCFETSQRSPNGLEQLHNSLVTLAQYCGGSVSEGNVHPLTKSRATLTLDVNLRDANGQSNPTSAAICEFMFKSGNVFITQNDALQRDFVLSSQSNGLPTTGAVLNSYRQVQYRPDPVTGQKCFYGASLHDAVLDAIAVTLHSPSILSDQITVPLNLYNRDPVKADAVRVLLQEAAHFGRGTCNVAAGAIVNSHETAPCYLITGEHAVKDLVARAGKIDFDPQMGWARAGIEQDIAKYTRGSAEQVTAAFQQETCFDVLKSLGIASEEDFQIDGISLGSPAPHR